MPSTYNGIGTHYVGKKNIQQRSGQCRSCGHNVQLKSYDTRLWFVIFFIPVIPLKRKRIVDYCPACRRHYAIELDKWETARQLEVSGALEKFRAAPTADSAIAAHRQLVEFHQIAEAAEFQKTMVAQFPDNAKIYSYLGAALEHLGQQNEAAEAYNQALKLRPDLPEARIGVARVYIRAGRLDEARTLLDFLEKPGAAQLYSLESLEALARAYQTAGRHAEALELFGKLIEALPKVAEYPGFRKTVKVSEKALGRTTSILPKQKFSFKRMLAGGGMTQSRANKRALVIFGVIAALVVLGFVISNEYIRHHRHIYLINAYNTPATVQIAGGGGVQNFRGVHTLDLPEGHYHAVITGPVPEELDIDVRDTYFNRSFGDAFWLVNVGGGALLEQIQATYSHNPKPGVITFHTGKTFEHIPKVTHPFEQLPQSVQVDSGGSKTLVGLDVFTGQPADVFEYYAEKHNNSDALDFAEHWLRAHPDDDTILGLFASTMQEQRDTTRLDTFLASGLNSRPVRIQWHRYYQDLHNRPADLAVLTAKYDQLLQAEPTNSVFLYLRGRLETNRADARADFEKALAADPKNAFANYALGYDLAAAGDWAGAKPLLAKAAALNPREPGFESLLFLTRLAAGEAPAIEKESRAGLAHDAFDYNAELRLLDALLAQGKSADATQASTDFVNRCRKEYGNRGGNLIRTIEYHTFYCTGDFAQLRALAEKDNSTSGRARLIMVLIEQEQLDAAAAKLEAAKDLDESEHLAFALAVAYRLKANEPAAAKWEARGIEILNTGNTETVRMAELLKRGTPPTRAEAESMAIAPQNKAVIIAMLAQKYPPARAELAELARKLNVAPDFPNHLVQRATAL